MATQNGTDIILLVDGERFGAATANEISLTRATRDTTNKDSAGWKENEYGLGEGTMNGSGLFFNENKNLVRYPEVLSNAAWIKSGLTVSTTLVNGPTDVKNGFQLTSLTSTDQLIQDCGDLAVDSYVFSVWLKGSGDIDLIIGDNDSEDALSVTLTSSWVRYSVVREMATGVDVYVSIKIDTATSLYVSQPQLELGLEATQYKATGRLFDYFRDAVINKTKLQCLVTNQTDFTLSGQCLVSNLVLTAPMEENTTFTADFNLSGIISTATI